MAQPGTPHTVGGLVSPRRLESFSDGVFAVAITLLVITLQVPASIGGGGDFVGELGSQWPAYVSLLISFASVGIIWINHHAVFTLVERVDRTLMLLNLALLLAVVLLPFPTELMGRAFQGGANQVPALVIYNLACLFMSLTFAAVFFYVTGSRRLRHQDLPDDYVRRLAPRFTSGAAVYAVAVGAAFLSPYLSLALNGATAVYYAVLRVEMGEPPAA